jgi:hypothetical protein
MLRYLARCAPVIAQALTHVRAIVSEFDRAIAATDRYQKLKRLTAESSGSATDCARQIYTEFYAHG